MPLFDISLETANKFYSFGWKASTVGAGITLLGIIFLMWGTRVRDHDFESKISETTLAAEQLHKGNLTLQTNLETERIARLQLEGKTEGFRLDIAKANERAEQARARSAEANEQAAKAAEGTAKALVEAAALKERAGKLEVGGVSAKKELLELQELTKPRHLTPTQRVAIIDILSKYPKGNCCVWVTHLKGDVESHDFAKELVSALLNGETVMSEGIDESFVTFPAGLCIDVHDNTQLPRASSLQLALQTALGYPVQIRLRTPTAPPDKKVVLNVGPKP